jgi:Amt family ammonium transporter
MAITTTMIAAATGGVLALIFNPLIGRKASLSTIINGILGALVGITASSGYVNIKSAIIIGGISGIIVLLGEEFLIKTKVIDDPVGAIPVHLFCGFWGTMAVGLFSTKDAGEFAAPNLLTQDNWLSQVAFQFFGWIVVMAFTFIFSLILWLMIGNLLYYMQVIVLRQKNPQVNSSPVIRSQSFNVSDLFSLFWSRGREGIRVSLSDELKGSDGVFSD